MERWRPTCCCCLCPRSPPVAARRDASGSGSCQGAHAGVARGCATRVSHSPADPSSPRLRSSSRCRRRAQRSLALSRHLSCCSAPSAALPAAPASFTAPPALLSVSLRWPFRLLMVMLLTRLALALLASPASRQPAAARRRLCESELSDETAYAAHYEDNSLSSTGFVVGA